MTKYINEYIEELESRILNEKITKKDIDDLIVKIGFFQHERLIHLLVTLFFALFAVVLTYLSFNNPMYSLIALAIIVLLAFYIKHYYFLENSVQYLYKLYDKINGK